MKYEHRIGMLPLAFALLCGPGVSEDKAVDEAIQANIVAAGYKE